MTNEPFCPLLKQPCRDDCAWADITYELTDDGVDREVFCSIAIIAAKMLGDDVEEIE